LVYRRSWKKYTKFGAGGMIGGDQDQFKPGYQAYGAIFGDITQFIGQRQKWSLGGQVGHGIYNREYEYASTNEKGFNKYAAGMYYSVSANYRMIVSKKILIIISPYWNLQNFRHREVEEFYSPPGIQRWKWVEHHQVTGLKVGVVF
jgi:hypothetical protein